MFLLDTNHCSQLVDGNIAIAQRIAEVGELAVFTCVIVRGELMDMAHRSERIALNMAKVQEFLDDIDVFLVDEETSDVYGSLKADLFARFGPREKSKRRNFTLPQLGISDNDLWIAAVAVQHSLTIVSADSDFARLQQIRPFPMENWLAL